MQTNLSQGGIFWRSTQFRRYGYQPVSAITGDMAVSNRHQMIASRSEVAGAEAQKTPAGAIRKQWAAS